MITPELLANWRACWSADRISSHLAGRSGISPREVAADETIDLDDRLWVICRALGYRDESAARTFAIDSAASVSHLAGSDRDQTEHARLVADLRRIYTLPECAGRASKLVARYAARDAARDAASSAAWDAARSSAWAAARGISDAAADVTADTAAAWAAVWAAARAAVWAAVWAVTGDAAWDAAWNATRHAAKAAAGDAVRVTVVRVALASAIVALGPDADGWV